MKHILLPILAVLLLAVPAVAAEYSLPFKVGGETLSVDTESFDLTTLAVLGGGGYGIWSWLKKRKANPADDAISKLPANLQQLVQALLGLWGKFPTGKKPVSFDGTVNFETGDPYTFHLSLGGKKSTQETK